MFRYWKINEIKDLPYAWIFCPEMENSHSLATIRDGYREFKKLEAYLVKKYHGWVACTELKHAHIMRFMGKMGAQPFEINLNEDKIWFKKDLKE